jgi:broad specificity phosphatase PhoE
VQFEAVYLARHGQTAWNVAGCRQGRLAEVAHGAEVARDGRWWSRTR